MERRKLLSWGGAILVSSAILGCGIIGCGGSTDPHTNSIVGAPGDPGTGGGAAPTPGGAGGSSGSNPSLAPGSTIFAENYGDEGEQALAGIAVDGKGNIYVAGNEMPVSTNPPGSSAPPATEGTAKGVFLLQYGPTGDLMWRQPFVPNPDPNTYSALQVTGVAVQPTTGLEILAGSLGGTVTIGGTTLTSSVDQSGFSANNLWLTAIDSAGYLVWTRLFQSPGSVFPSQVFVTSSGDIEVTGGMVDNASVGGAPLCCGDGATGPRFIARFSPTGDPTWSYGITGFFFPIHAGADADGGVAIGGVVNGTFGYRGETFSTGGGPFEVNGSAVLRLDPQGNKRWVKTYLTSTGASQLGAAVDQSQNVLVYGGFNTTLDFGAGHTLTGPAPTSGKEDGVIAKLAPDGTTIWAQQIAGGIGNQFGASIATNAAGDIAFANTGDGFSAGPTFGGVSPLPQTPFGLFGNFVFVLAPDGTLVWSRGFDTGPFGGGPAAPATGLAFDPSGRVALNGMFNQTVDFGTGPMTAPGQTAHNGSGPSFIPDNVFTLLLAP